MILKKLINATPMIKKWIPHFFAALLFIAIALLFFYPVLQGKKIYQGDIVQYIGMSKEQNDFRKAHKTETYWTNSAFGGMPTYQTGANYPHTYIKKIDAAIRFLPRPADYLFLYFLGGYVLLLTLKLNWRIASLGALAFGFSTYLIIILTVGHNSKAHAIGYFPFVLAGVLLIFQRRYLWGFILSAFAIALEIQANHFQMTYYLIFLLLIVGMVYLADAWKRKELPHFFKSAGLAVVAAFLALSLNASAFLATREYTQWSTRSKSELTLNPDGTPKEKTAGLSREYITEYSYGIAESLNLFVPRLFGGSNNERLGENSHTYQFLLNQGVPTAQAKSFTQGAPTYWGKQPIVAAPAYIGAVVVFLFIVALFVVKGRIKWWLVGGTVVSLILSWGEHAGFLTNMMIDYMPLYNKFRAVSSIQVILELCVPVLAVIGLANLISPDKKDKTPFLKALKWSTLIVLGIVATLFLAKGSFHFQGVNDSYYRQLFSQMGLPQLMDMIVLDRKAIYNQDVLRSLVFVLLTASVLWFFLKGKIKPGYFLMAIAALLLADLVGVDRRYVSEANFVNSRTMEKPFEPSAADTQIVKDTTHYRVFEPALALSGARTSYFHKAIGGYHAAKSRRFQELYDFQIAKNNTEVLNMLNVKYVIQADETGVPRVYENPAANGNAWFVHSVLTTPNADAELKALDSVPTKEKAVIRRNALAGISLPERFERDSAAFVKLITYQPNYLKYVSSNQFNGFAVFSEMYYPHGWRITIDGKPVSHIRANYVLRALPIPAGKHTIEFSFQPSVVKKGGAISLAGSILMGILVIGALGYEFRKKKSIS